MPPKRRETDEEAARRNAMFAEKRQQQIAQSRPLSDVEARMFRPKINAGGRLQH